MITVLLWSLGALAILSGLVLLWCLARINPQEAWEEFEAELPPAKDCRARDDLT